MGALNMIGQYASTACAPKSDLRRSEGRFPTSSCRALDSLQPACQAGSGLSL